MGISVTALVLIMKYLSACGWLGAQALRDNELNSTGNYGLQVILLTEISPTVSSFYHHDQNRR
eukprot:COSAG01_NODE_23_length_37704_cov_30.005877_38_plen_63_part_00